MGRLGSSNVGGFAVSFALVVAVSRVASAAWAPTPVGDPSPDARTEQDVPATAAALLGAGDSAIEARQVAAATRFYERVVREFPASPEAGAARRALRIMAALAPGNVAGPPGASSPPPSGFGEAAAGPEIAAGDAEANAAANETPQPASGDIIMREEPYSTRTSERLRLTSWEKLDFGVTSFLYGMSLGFSYALGAHPSDAAGATTSIAFGALAYTLGAVAYLRLADPDRGDLPLALAITSYVPTTTLLIANVASDNPDSEKTSLVVAAAGLFSIPVAVLATRKFDLDPGDTQLVRDAGFWGLVLATGGTLGFGGDLVPAYPGSPYQYYQGPSGRTVAGLSLVGLYGGLGLGVLAAAKTEISLERVRVTTWGGYGGGLLGTLIGIGVAGNSGSPGDRAVYRGLTIGALAGLVVTFASTGSMDGIPPESAPGRHATAHRLTPAFLPVASVDGKTHPGWGLAYAMP